MISLHSILLGSLALMALSAFWSLTCIFVGCLSCRKCAFVTLRCAYHKGMHSTAAKHRNDNNSPPPAIGHVLLNHVQRVISKVISKHKLALIPVHGLTIIPNAKEPQHFGVPLQKLHIGPVVLFLDDARRGKGRMPVRQFHLGAVHPTRHTSYLEQTS
jgi:hypothetical protein